ncbi:MAG TPA: hypothetical protein VN281_21695, partial [Verrucomicrobiae bacterium]|nr:hypothetical protein [Verrucomicrobiae bacterium]
IACRDVEMAYTNHSAATGANLLTGGYTLNAALTTASSNVYERTISLPFTNQTVFEQVWLTNSPQPGTAHIVSAATFGNVSITNSVNLIMNPGFGAAIISDNPGSTAQGLSEPVAQQGNVVVVGHKEGVTVVDGGFNTAVSANGFVNVANNYTTLPITSISGLNRNTENQIPDYTTQGANPAVLYNLGRYIALADASGTHYMNLQTFINAVQPGTLLEGVIVVDVHNANEAGTSSLNPTTLPNGINIRGALYFNFLPSFGSTSKLINTAALNINGANLSGLVATNPATYTTSYPPVYTNAADNPINVSITSLGYSNVVAGENIPALMYSGGILALRGNVNISGIVFTPNFAEMVTTADGQLQYIRGTMIAGGGVFDQNKNASISIISLDPRLVGPDRVTVTYWQ